MADPTAVPVIIGVADLRSGRAGMPAPPREPLDLITEATRAALADTGVDGIGSHVDTIYAVKTASWSYDDLPGLLARRVGAQAPRTHTSSIGGHWPAALLDRLGSEIAEKRSTVALLVGGEALASVRALGKAGTDPIDPGWTAAPGGPPDFRGDDLGSPEMLRAQVFTPTRVYPLFDNRLGHDLGITPAQSRLRAAQMYSSFSTIASRHASAWSPTVRSADEIATPGPGNRRISDAYTLAMNAMPYVDQAAAVVLCSLAAARELGVPEGRIVHLWGGAGASDASDVLARTVFGESPALSSAVRRTLDRAAITGTDLAVIDAYSCFPVVPTLLIRALGLPETTVPSILGGHSFFGGPLNSYTLHSIAEATRIIRAGDVDGPALVHANGGYLTHQHTVVLCATPHPDGYIGDPEPAPITPTGPALVHGYHGDAEIVTATVEFDRDGEPAVGIVIASTPDGRRVAGHTDHNGAAALMHHTADGSRSLVGATLGITDHDGLIEVRLHDAPAG